MLGPFRILMAVGLWLMAMTTTHAQQVADLKFQFKNNSPTYAAGSGPKISIDKAHSPFVQRGTYDPFVKLMREDGYQVEYSETDITMQVLKGLDIFVIVNAYKKNFANFSVMQPPSAYKDSEIDALRDWVSTGGRLLLIADHAPFAGGTVKLAENFGFTIFNSFVLEESSLPFIHGKIRYSLSNGINSEHPIVKSSKIDHVLTFAGSGFIPPANAKSIFTIPSGYIAAMTQKRSELANAPRIQVSGLSQGATLELGTGRIAVFAEAATFTAQIINGSELHGMNNPRADQNAMFALATMGWLAQGLTGTY